MIKKLKTKLIFIIENEYLELIILYTILISILISLVLAPILMGILYAMAYFVRDITGDFFDPFTSLVRTLLAYGFLIIIGIVFVVLLIMLIKFIRKRKGKLLKTSLIYDVFVNHDRDFKTMPGLVLSILFMLIFIVNFLFRIGNYRPRFFSLFVLLSAITMSLTTISYIVQINKIMANIKNIGKLNSGPSPEGQYLFSQKAIDMLKDTDENIKEAINEQLKSERLKTELITNISHDLKTPLTSIINYTDLLKNHIDFDSEDKEVIEYIEVLDRNSHRLKILITDLVYASKAETGNVDINLDILDINELVFQVYGEFDYLFKHKGINFVFEPKEDIYVYADSNHLGRVLINIMDNAIKYSQEATRIYGATKIEDDYTIFSLKNISKDQLNISPEELMEQFVRGERSRHTDGSGLGLYISRSLMDLMEGELQVGIDGDLFEIKIMIPSIKEDKYEL